MKKKVETVRLEMVLPKHLKDSLKEISEKKGISMSEYIKDTLKAAIARDS